jgi:hypothetical protein
MIAPIAPKTAHPQPAPRPSPTNPPVREATALFLGVRGYGGPLAAQLSAEAILITLYLLFWDPQRKRRQATWVVNSSLLMACVWLTLFAVTLH